MIKLLRIIFLLSGILTFGAAITFSVIYYLASNSLPQYQQKLSSELIHENVIISRDSYAIPYIEANSDFDSFFGLGYVHAQDRLWQMVLLRRIAQGKLSEILGQSALEDDILMRTIGIYNSAIKSEKHQTKNTLALLESYSSGINTYIKQIATQGLGRGSPEFFLFTPKISPWRPADTIALIKLIAFVSTNKAKLEVLRTQLLLEKINPERLEDLFAEPPLINDIKNQTISYFNKNNFLTPFRNLPNALANNSSKFSLGLLNISSLGASNVFAAMPFRSATGSTLAASDPHSALTAPSNFMLVNMQLSSGVVVGGTIPGIPAILIGRNKDIGWGISNAQIDDQDLFIEKLNPKDNLEYYGPKGLTEIKVTTQIINIKDKKSITLQIKNTKNGPILPNNALGVETIRPKGHEISINWTGLTNDDRSIEALISIMRSNSITDAKKKLFLLTAPGQNIMLVDKNNMVIFTAGKVPKRNIANATKGKIPSLGWKRENTWLGFLPFETNPKIENPKTGIVVNTNNKTTNEPFPYHISYDWGDSQRIVRASNLLNKRKFHSVNSFKEIQTDTVSISARILLPLLAKNLWFSDQANREFKLTDIEEKILSELSAWNGNMSQNNSEPLIYVSWLREFQQMLMIDDLGTIYNRLTNIRPLFLERVLRNKNGASAWCDVIQTSQKEACDEIARRSFKIAIKKLVNQYGEVTENWRWGEAHVAIHRSQLLDSWPILSFFTNIVHEISGGDNTIMMSRTSNPLKGKLTANHGSTLRAIFDFSQTTDALFIISTGQSGHFLSRHYDDQSFLWQTEQYIPIKYDKQFSNKVDKSTITFNPAKQSN